MGLLRVRPRLRGWTQGSSPQSVAKCRGGRAAVQGLSQRVHRRGGFARGWASQCNRCYQRMKEHACSLGSTPPCCPGPSSSVCRDHGVACVQAAQCPAQVLRRTCWPRSPENPMAPPRCSQPSEALVGCLLCGPAGAEGILCPQVSAGRPADLTGLLVVHERHPAWGGGGLCLRPGQPILCLWGEHAWGQQGPACPHPCPLYLWSEQPEVLGSDVCVSSAGS